MTTATTPTVDEVEDLAARYEGDATSAGRMACGPELSAEGSEYYEAEARASAIIALALRALAEGMRREAVAPVAWITKAGLENFQKGTDPEKHVLLRYGGGLRVALYLAPPSPSYADGRRDGLEEAAAVAKNFGPSRPLASNRPSERVLGRWEGEQAASEEIAERIRALTESNEP